MQFTYMLYVMKMWIYLFNIYLFIFFFLDHYYFVQNSTRQVNIRCNFNFHAWGKPAVNSVVNAIFS